ncbi:MAG: hypothetical protein AAFQ14_08220 [Cyanobacteria bacterium J06621_12]
MTRSGDTYKIGQAGAVGKYARSDNNTFINLEQKQTLAEAAEEIQQLLDRLEQTYSQEEAKQRAAQDLANKAKKDSSFRGNMIKWGQYLGDVAAKTTVAEAVKGVISLALSML